MFMNRLKKESLLILFIAGVLLSPLIGMIYSPSVPFKPNFRAIQPLSARQDAFIQFMVPKIAYSNDQTIKIRSHIQTLVNIWQQVHGLSYSDRSWLKKIAAVYQVPDFKISNPDTVKELLMRVDEIPTSLVLAQAANESGWGTSRFAVQADNFFGQHCYVIGCGIPPLGQTSGDFEVQKFRNVQSAIDDYIYNLNTNSSYERFRQMRAALRAGGQPLAGFRLAPYLTNYSDLGDQYSLLIASIIINHNLMQYDAINDQILD